MASQLFLQIAVCALLIYLNGHIVQSKRYTDDTPQFEGCARPGDHSGELGDEGAHSHNQQHIIHAYRSHVKSHPQQNSRKDQLHTKHTQPKRNDLIKEQRHHKNKNAQWEIHEKNKNFKPPQMDTGFQSSEKVSAAQLENAIDNTDRNTLLEWYDYAYGLKELLERVEEGAKKCGCTSMKEPILDTEKRINHALNAVSNKLRYGSSNPAKHENK